MKLIKKIRERMLRFKVPLIYLSIFLAIIFTSYGYAALNTDLSISGEAYVRVDEDIRITNINVVSSENQGYETYNSKYSKDTTSMFTTLPTANSSVTYEITVKNKSSDRYILSSLIESTYSNKNIKYELIGLKVNDIIDGKEERNFKIKLTTNNNDQICDLVLNYKFEKYKIEPPFIIVKNGICSISVLGKATDGIKDYEYYISNTNTKPSDDVSINGTTSNEVSFDDLNMHYIFYRTVSKNDYKSDWSDGIKVRRRILIFNKQYDIIDKKPTLTTSSSEAKDEDGLYESTDTNNGNPTYYFRGNVTDNYVNFAGFIWRILRVNEDGTIRLILQDGIDDNKTYYFNIPASNYYYTNSNIAKDTLVDWYNKNIGNNSNYSKNIVTGNYFCEQIKIKPKTEWSTGNATTTVFDKNYVPTFKCSADGNGKGLVNSNIALITFDEILYAGLYPYLDGDGCYLYSEYHYYTMSPAGIDKNGTSFLWVNGKFTSLGSASGTYIYKPVINLKSSAVATGNGTNISPFVIS